MRTLTYRKATLEDLEQVIELYKACIQEMDRKEIDQWDINWYPCPDILEEDIRREEMYIGLVEGEVACAFVLNEDYDEQYQNGIWQYDGSFRVIHRLCVNPSFQNRGIARQTMSFIEQILTEQNIRSIRLDAFTKNPYALALYEHLGYQAVGQINWPKGVFKLYEKVW